MTTLHFINSLQDLETWLLAQAPSRILLLCDENTQRDCLPLLPQSLLQKIDARICIPAGESHKTLETCQYVWSQFLAAGADRSSLVLNLGGGVVGDLGGFCAATFKRGMDFVQIPTSLLAQVDASWGAKTGIDFQGVKNGIGLFAEPKAVFVYAPFLQTLPFDELRSGLAELLKHALIADAELWRDLRNLPPQLQGIDWTQYIHKGLTIKQNIVAQDPLERGLRSLLNLGHTLGHALESWSWQTKRPLLHGEAVAWGILAELPLSTALSQAQKQEIQQVIQTFYPPNLYAHIPSLSTLKNLVLQDKKAAGRQLKFPVLETIGQASVRVLSWADLFEALDF